MYKNYNADAIKRHYDKHDLCLLATASCQIKGIALEVCDGLDRKEGTLYKFFKAIADDQGELADITWDILFPGVFH